MSSLAVSLNMKSFKNLCARFTSSRAVMVRGRPGIGKSESVYQVASDLRSEFYRSVENCRTASQTMRAESSFQKALERFWNQHGSEERYAGVDQTIWHYDMGIPVVQRRLSQLTEGDIVGIPSDNGIGTVFRPTEWLIFTCMYPCVLFLDELNRAIKGVEQATFEIADSKAFYGHLMHKESRVYTAMNIGESFDVTPMDPAAISRYAVVDLDPTLDDWIEFAREHCDGRVANFMVANPRLLEFQGEFEPNKKVYDRRAWVNLDAELTHSKLYDSPNDPVFLHMCAAMVGFEAGNQFWNYCKTVENDISADDVVKGWSKAKTRLPKDRDLLQQKYVEMASKVADYLTRNVITDEGGANIGAFMVDAAASGAPEPVMAVWQGLNKNRKNLFRVSSHISDLMVRLTSNQPKGGKK